MQDRHQAKRVFVALWLLATAAKCAIAARLPLFVDEAFYWQEGRHLALAYSDLPGLTAWLTRLGVELGGHHALALRMPFLLIAALLPWLVARIGAREFDEAAGWQAGSLVVLMPLSGTLGLLALPDVPMALATVLCMDAGARLLRRVDAAAVATLALGLAIGALSHYRFVGVIGIGTIALLALPQGRRALLDARVWAALAIGALAWLPLLLWNLQHADAGLRFQLVDRHPWSFDARGAWFIAVQALLATPLLFLALLQLCVRALRAGAQPPWRYLGLLGAASTFGFFALGFFADSERVSFHWTLPGYLALLVAVPVLLRSWPRALRMATWLMAALGLAALLAYYLAVSVPAWRAHWAGDKSYPYNFAGWDELAVAVREELRAMPAGTVLLADNFKIGAELGFALRDPRIAVLDHPLNHKHGRAPQLALSGLAHAGRPQAPTLLVASSTDVKLRDLLDRYQWLCAQLGALPPPRVINSDHGAQRFLLFRLPAGGAEGDCVTPAIAHINQPESGARVPPRFALRGWAIKDVAGVEAVTVTLDGKPVALAEYGHRDEWPARFYRDASRDPQQPAIAFSAQIDASALAPGRHWLGLVIHGRDGSREAWAEQPVVIDPAMGEP
ncbi:ArnT family glycosyltransferase [Pseudoxanthomonas mexicana]|uniref:ArnT family glycosyltransferase n=1 Tax=Pseudoxanthomonas mexicana TaxID=128785 RepID=UPI00398AD866